MTWDSSKWTVVSAVTGVLALLVPFLLLVLGRDTKELTIETVSTAILVDLSDPKLSSLKLTYKDISVSQLAVATIEVRNSGTRPIERADFELPIVLRFNNPLDVLAVTLSEKTPHDLNPLINSDVNGISVAPLLLNPGDQFRITVQIRGKFNEPVVEARISGVPSILRREFHASLPLRRGIILIVGTIVTTVINLYFVILTSPPIRRYRPVTLVPLPESLIMLVVLSFANAVLFAEGMKIFAPELSDLQFVFVYVGFSILCGFVLIPLAIRRTSRLWAMLDARA